MPAGGAGHGGRPCSRVSAGPRAVPTTARDAADKHEHAEDQMFVDMLPGVNSPSDVEDYSEDLQLLASPSLQRRRSKAESHSWHLHSRVHGWSAVSAELSKLEAQHCHGAKFGSGGSRTTLDHVIYRYRCAMHNYIACPWLCRVRIHRNLGDSFTGVVVDSRAAIHAQHQCEIEMVSGVHHIEHNVEQKKGVHCLYSAMASGNACMLSWSRHQIAT
jgi:hypothetical protein